MIGALLSIRQAGVGQAQQGSVRRLLDQVDLDQALPRLIHLTAVPADDSQAARPISGISPLRD
jgi:hypothetical protein